RPVFSRRSFTSFADISIEYLLNRVISCTKMKRVVSSVKCVPPRLEIYNIYAGLIKPAPNTVLTLHSRILLLLPVRQPVALFPVFQLQLEQQPLLPLRSPDILPVWSLQLSGPRLRLPAKKPHTWTSH